MSSVALLPDFTVELDGQSLLQDAAATLEEIHVRQCLSQPSLCELTFHLPMDPVASLEAVSTGAQLRVTAGPQSSVLFDGEVTGLEYTYSPSSGQIIRVRGYDALHRLRKRQPIKVYQEVTPSDLTSELIANLGLSLEAEEPGPVFPRIIQYNQSDFEILASVARRAGLYFTLRGNVLHLVTLQGTGDAVPLDLKSTLHEARVEVNAEHSCRSVVAHGWDASRVEEHQGRAQQPRSGRDVQASAPPDKFGADGMRTLTGEAFPDDRYADAVAQAELDVRDAREVMLWGVAEGNPDLMPGARVSISDLGTNLSGQYVLTEVTHRFNRSSGFVSEISSAPPASERQSKSAFAAWGKVTNIGDPENLGRVQVTLPAFGEVETGWMGVLAAGAGNGKGMVSLPDVGDEVLVLFVNGELSHGVVLGGLYGLHGPGDYGVEGSAVRRYTWATPGGQKVRLDDSGESIRVENKGGSFVDLSPQKVLLHSAVDLLVEAPGREVVIVGERIDFRKG